MAYIVGFDVLLFGIIINMIVQFEIIADFLRDFNSKIDENYLSRCRKIGLVFPNGVDGNTMRNAVLLKCIHHHNILIKMCEMLEGIYSPIIFGNFAASLVAICVSSVVMVYLLF